MFIAKISRKLAVHGQSHWEDEAHYPDHQGDSEQDDETVLTDPFALVSAAERLSATETLELGQWNPRRLGAMNREDFFCSHQNHSNICDL